MVDIALYKTTQQAAAELGVSVGRVRTLIQILRCGTRVGRDWLLAPEDIAAMAQRCRRRGRPRAASTEHEA